MTLFRSLSSNIFKLDVVNHRIFRFFIAYYGAKLLYIRLDSQTLMLSRTIAYLLRLVPSYFSDGVREDYFC